MNEPNKNSVIALVVESLSSKKPLEYHRWLNAVGYEKIRGCYRKKDMIVVWADEVEEEYYQYCQKHY